MLQWVKQFHVQLHESCYCKLEENIKSISLKIIVIYLSII